MKTFKITKASGIENEVGFIGDLTIGGRKIPVTYHEVFDLDGCFWMLSDAATGTRIRGGKTRAEAKKNALAKIEEIGSDLFFEARAKFMEIAYGGKTISEFTGRKVSKAKTAKYNAWAKRVKKARGVTGTFA